MAFTQKTLTFTIQLGTGSFGETGLNTVDVSGRRASATIIENSAPGSSTAQVAIYGLPLSLLNQLSTLGTLQMDYVRRNLITIKAGDLGAESIIFSGTILTAYADFNSSPDIPLNISASGGAIAKMKPAAPFSYNGSIDAVTIIEGIAKQMGCTVKNNGVSCMLSNPYLAGVLWDQLDAVRVAGLFHLSLSRDESTINIWPRFGSLGNDPPLISKDTGMVGYPAPSNSNVSVRTLYNPSLYLGGQVKIDSVVQPACGTWTIQGIQHDLACLFLEDAPWFTSLLAYRLGQPTTQTI